VAQFARPDSVVSNSGFNASAGTLDSTIDESSRNDADYNWTDAPGTNFEVGLSNATDPVSSSGHVVRFAARYTMGARDFTVTLKQGGSTIASTTISMTASFADYSFTLSGAEADSITNYNDLRLYFTHPGTLMGALEEVQVSWAEFEVPDAPPAPVDAIVPQLRPVKRTDKDLLILLEEIR
jgi:hypothetical protein